jgi:hypothetical protein
MHPSLSIDYPYDECQVINQQQAYNTWEANSEQLDLIREIQYSGNYYWQGLVFPQSLYLPSTVNPTNGIPGLATVNGTSIIPAGTYVTSITAYSSQPSGFRFKLYDKGSKASIFYTDYAFQRIVASSMLTTGIYQYAPSDPGSNLDQPIGPGYLMSPFIITGPGVLGWEIVNMSPSTNVLQVLLSCAVPIAARSVGQMVVSK